MGAKTPEGENEAEAKDRIHAFISRGASVDEGEIQRIIGEYRKLRLDILCKAK